MTTDLTSATTGAASMDDGEQDVRVRLQAALAELYTIGDVIGRGASAFVFAARDRRHFDREVALKVIRPEVAASVGVARFRREMEMAARLNHPCRRFDLPQYGQQGVHTTQCGTSFG